MMDEELKHIQSLVESGKIDLDRLGKLSEMALESLSKDGAESLMKSAAGRPPSIRSLQRSITGLKRMVAGMQKGRARSMGSLTKSIQSIKKAPRRVLTPKKGPFYKDIKFIVPTIGLGTAVTVGAGSKAYGAMKFRSALSDLKKDPEVRQNQAKAISIANMVRRWAPSVAGDPDVLKGTVKNIMRFPDSYLSYDIAKKLSEVEKDYQATHGLLSLLQKRVL